MNFKILVLASSLLSFVTVASWCKAADPFAPSFGAVEPTWIYRSFLVQPDAGDEAKAIKWASGKLYIEDATDLPEGDDDFRVVGNLNLDAGLELRVTGGGSNEKSADQPATFHAIGTVIEAGPAIGAEYRLKGWVFPDATGKVQRIEGTIALTKGTNRAPKIGPSRRPVGTVGLFRLSK